MNCRRFDSTHECRARGDPEHVPGSARARTRCLHRLRHHRGRTCPATQPRAGHRTRAGNRTRRSRHSLSRPLQQYTTPQYCGQQFPAAAVIGGGETRRLCLQQSRFGPEAPSLQTEPGHQCDAQSASANTESPLRRSLERVFYLYSYEILVSEGGLGRLRHGL